MHESETKTRFTRHRHLLHDRLSDQAAQHPQPDGFSSQAIALVEKELAAFPEIRTQWTRKGSLLAFLPGQGDPDAPITRGLTAHVDTLGGMVREIKASGRLELTNVGGFAWGSIEGENCLVHTRENGTVRGSLLPHKASVHVYDNVRDDKREAASMEVRLDARVSSAAEVRELGIEVGDFVSFDPRVEVVNGFVKSRHLDDKASVANLVTAIKALHDHNLTPRESTCFLFSNFEEVGIGGSSDFPVSLKNWWRWIWLPLVTDRLRMNITPAFALRMPAVRITTSFQTNCATWQRRMTSR